VSPVETAIIKEISKTQGMIQRLVRRREAYRVALENIQHGRDWQGELGYWIEESEVAQIGALQSCVSLLVGVAGPISEALDVHRENSAVLWNAAQNVRSRLAEINEVLYEGRVPPTSSTELRAAAATLQDIYGKLTSGMKAEDALTERFRHLQEFSDKLMDAVKLIELGKGVQTKHDLLLAAKLIEDFAVDALKDAGLVKAQQKLVKAGQIAGAQTTRLGNFVIDYGYHSARFYLAWSSVQEILARIDDVNKVSTVLTRNIGDTTNQINALRSELRQLQESRQNEDAAERILNMRWQKEVREAYLAGEWFSQQGGLRARGEPIAR